MGCARSPDTFDGWRCRAGGSGASRAEIEGGYLSAFADGATVRVFNELGEVICRIRVDERVREGVVSMPKGAWRKSSMNGKTSTALCPTHLNVVGGGACFNDARVEIARS